MATALYGLSLLGDVQRGERADQVQGEADMLWLGGMRICLGSVLFVFPCSLFRDRIEGDVGDTGGGKSAAHGSRGEGGGAGCEKLESKVSISAWVVLCSFVSWALLMHCSWEMLGESSEKSTHTVSSHLGLGSMRRELLRIFILSGLNWLTSEI